MSKHEIKKILEISVKIAFLRLGLSLTSHAHFIIDEPPQAMDGDWFKWFD